MCEDNVLKKFTLLELLIVVAIIGVLVTILLPSLQSAKEKAKIAICLNNQRQLATAYLTYASKNDQLAIKHSWYNDIVGTTGVHRWGQNYPIEKRPLNEFASPEIGVCPSDKGDTWYRWNNNEAYQFGSSYIAPFATRNTIAKSTNIGANDNIRILKFDRPDRKILFHIVNLQYPRDFNHSSGKAKWHDPKNPRYPVAFMDGHAEFHNFSWRLLSDYYPKAPLNRVVRRQLNRSGTSIADYKAQWSIENLGYY